MKTAVAVISAPRIEPTVEQTVQSLLDTGFRRENIMIFTEPGVLIDSPVDKVFRPNAISRLLPDLEPSPQGVFGNFQNYAQTLSDLRFQHPDADFYLIVEDDSLFCNDVRDFCERLNWMPEWGAVSLYTPTLRGYTKPGDQPDIRRVVRDNHVGCLAILFPQRVLVNILRSAAILGLKWQGGHGQAGCQPWERKASDAWIGHMIRYHGVELMCVTHSLVHHYCPDSLKETGNSSLGNGRNRGCRVEANWLGIRSASTIYSKFLK